MIDLMVYVACDQYYQGYALGKSDGTASGTGIAVNLTGFSDPRANSYKDASGDWVVELTDRTGPAGQPGAGIHYLLPTPISGPLPTATANLDIIANTYSLVTRGSLLYYADFDSNVIQCADMTAGYSIQQYGPDGDQPAFTYDNDPENSAYHMGMRILKTQEYDANGALYDVMYGLFSNGSSYSGPWNNSQIVRLVFGNGGRLIETNRVDVAPNATGMVLVPKYLPTPEGSVAGNFLITTAIGGEQQSGSGNGVNSVVSVFKAGEGLRKIANAAVATFAMQDLSIDFKGISVGPTVDNDAWLWIIGSSYTSSWTSNWTARQTKASVIIEKALEIEADSTVEPLTFGDFTNVLQNTFTTGYFYMVAFTSQTSDGNGTLLLGASGGAGDFVNVYQVTASGGAAITSPVQLDSTTLYGASDCNVNSLTVFSEAGAQSYKPSPPAAAMAMKKKKAPEKK